MLTLSFTRGLASMALAITAPSSVIPDATSPVHAAEAATPDGAHARAQAAQAFLATLTEAQRRAVLFRFDDDVQRRRWSNFPTSFVPRAGVKWGDLDEHQRTALLALLGTILSPDGVAMVREQMAADEVLRVHPRGPGPGGFHGPPQGGERRPPPAGFAGGPTGSHGPPPKVGGPSDGFARFPGEVRGFPPGPGGSGGRGGADFGSDFYYVSMLGTPSPDGPWMLQFGGHHLAINATIVGGQVTLSPSLTGGEPLRFDQDGRRIYIVEKEVTAAAALLASFTADQRAKAVVSSQRIDLVLGPGHDGQVLQPEGLAGAAMSAVQKKMFMALIEARLGILNEAARAPAMAVVRGDLDRTYFAWFGADVPLGDAYFRVTGPTVLIEYSPQDMDGDATDHAHNVYRDPTNEYGSKWIAAR